MLKRIALMTALLVAPLALSPDSVAAQERGMEQATAAAANGLATSAENGRPTSNPAGMQNRPGQDVPPGMMLTRPPAPAAEPAPEEPAEECFPEFKLIDGMMKLVDCNGNVIG